MARSKRNARRARAAANRGPEPTASPTPSRSRPWFELSSVLALVGLTVVVGALYVRTASRDIVLGDSPELTGAAATLGVAHPPGYPVWTMIGYLFTLVPVGTIPFRVSLFSVAAAVACVVVVYLTARRLTGRAIASATAALVFALVPVVWSWSVVPEVFPLADAIAASLVLLLLVWHQDGDPRWFIAAAFVGGIGVAHQQTIVLLGPAILYLAWHHRSRFRGGGLVLRGGLAGAAGLLPYLYLPIAAARHAPWNWGEISSLSDFVGHMLRVGYGTGSLVSVPQFQGGSVLDRLLAFASAFTVPEAVLGAIGLAALYQRDRVWCLFTVVAFAVAGPLFIVYTNVNLAYPVLHAVIERFFLLPQVVLAPAAAVGIVAIVDALKVTAIARVGPAVLSAGALAAAAGVAAAQFPKIDQSDDHVARSFAEDILQSTRPGVILLTAGDAVLGPVVYLQAIEGQRADVTVVQMPLLWGEWYVRQLRREHPRLALGFDKLDGLRGTLRNLVDPNGFDHVDIIGSLIDDSLGSTYALYRRGLVEELRQKPATVDLEAFVAQNDAALRGYRITSPAVPPRAWDRLILNDYALAASDIGDVYQRSKRYAEARQWYERALLMSPDLAEAKAGLATLPP